MRTIQFILLLLVALPVAAQDRATAEVEAGTVSLDTEAISSASEDEVPVEDLDDVTPSSVGDDGASTGSEPLETQEEKESTPDKPNEEASSQPVEESVENIQASPSAENASLPDASVDAETSESSDKQPPVQTGPLIDILGPSLLKLEMLDESHAQLAAEYTSDALRGKKVIGLYFSADWCGPCRQFTPELVSFYKKMNERRGKKDQFEIVWISRCRDLESFGQYFTHMGGWYALPPEEAMGQRGQMLSEKYKVKGIPHLALLDDMGNVITLEARTKIPQDKAGVGFPWRNPLVTFYMTVLPRSLRMMVKSQIAGAKDKLFGKLKKVFGLQRYSRA